MKYKPLIVKAYWRECGLPAPKLELVFHPTRLWRFDFCWPEQMVALEVQGGIWTHGRHTRGAALKLEHEKLNAAAGLGWRVLYCEPRAVCTEALVRQLRAALEYKH